MAANAGETKVKLWEGICYPENMRDDWQDEIDDILQVPFAYAVHDIDHDQKSKQRKTHAHVIVVWGGNTTRKAIPHGITALPGMCAMTQTAPRSCWRRGRASTTGCPTVVRTMGVRGGKRKNGEGQNPSPFR